MENKQIKVIIEGVGILKSEIKKQTIHLQAESKVSDLMCKIKIKKGIQIAVFINGKRMNLKTKLNDGDSIKIVPLFIGG